MTKELILREILFGTVGGLGLFLFGMGLMSDGLKKVAGQRLRKIVESMTKRPMTAFLVGAGVTALVQSSLLRPLWLSVSLMPHC